MMTRGKRRRPGTVTPSIAGKKPKAGVSKSPGRSRSRAPVPAINRASGSHPSALARQPVIPTTSAAPAPAQTTSSTASSSATANLLPELTSAISAAVVQSLRSAGLLSTEDTASDPAAAVQGSVAAVVQDITGEGQIANSQFANSVLEPGSLETDTRPEKIHQLISVPLSSKVPDKTQTKIWANEYIDLGTLLSPLLGDPKYNFTVKSSSLSSQPIVSLEPAQASKRIVTIDQWTTAFQTFVAIYTVRFPNSAPGLMKYRATVRDLAAKNANWRYYDENFRYLRQKSLFPWEEIHWELWLQAHHMTSSSSQGNPANNINRQVKQSFPRGFCWKFHQGDKCFGCNFKHNCFKCGAVHLASKCKQIKPSAPTSRTPASTTATNSSQSR